MVRRRAAPSADDAWRRRENHEATGRATSFETRFALLRMRDGAENASPQKHLSRCGGTPAHARQGWKAWRNDPPSGPYLLTLEDHITADEQYDGAGDQAHYLRPCNHHALPEG